MGPHLQLPQCQEFSIKVFHHKGWLIKALLVGPRKAPGQHAPDGWSMEAEGFHITYQEFGQKETWHFFICPPECHANTPNNIKQQSLARVFMLFFCQPISTDWMLLEKYYSNTSPSNSSKMDIPTTLPGLLRSLTVRTCDGMLGMFWQQDFMVIAVGFTPPPWPVLVVKSPPIACRYSYLIIRSWGVILPMTRDSFGYVYIYI